MKKPYGNRKSKTVYVHIIQHILDAIVMEVRRTKITVPLINLSIKR